jgi:hypothetical protein
MSISPEELTEELEDLIRSIRSGQLDQKGAGARLEGLYKQTSPVSVGSCSCSTTCPQCNKPVTITLS